MHRTAIAATGVTTPTRSLRARLALATFAFVAGAWSASVASAETPEGYKIGFVTSTTGVGKLGDSNDTGHWVETNGSGLAGLEAGDSICQVRAEAGGLASSGKPVFRAWLSDTNDDAYCRVQGLTGKKGDVGPCADGTLTGAGPWVLPDGRLFAPELDTLTTSFLSQLYVPATVTETGSSVLEDAYYTGTFETGGAATADYRRDDWQDGTVGTNYKGGRTDGTLSWSSGSVSGCNSTLRLLCLEEGPGTDPPLPSEPGALVFVTSKSGKGDLTIWADSGGQPGLVGADAVCVALASAAGLPEPTSFVAWLSDTASNAKDRLTTDGPWRRLDGFEIAATKSDLLDGYLAAPISVDETLSHQPDEVWTGTTTDGIRAPDRCSDWANDLSGTGYRGSVYRTHNYWTDFNHGGACTAARRLYCFSNVVTIFWNRFEPDDPFAWSSFEPPL